MISLQKIATILSLYNNKKPKLIHSQPIGKVLMKNLAWLLLLVISFNCPILFAADETEGTGSVAGSTRCDNEKLYDCKDCEGDHGPKLTKTAIQYAHRL
jgi:hypothetical protein